MSDTRVKAIEADTTFWQINWCYVHPPERGAQVCTNDNSRLWMPVKVEDDTGHINIYMREKAALDLSHTDSKDEFEAAWADDSMDFPKKKLLSRSFANPRRRRLPIAETVLNGVVTFNAT